jgi:hypothetical protein
VAHTRSGLKVKAVLDTNQYETGVETPDEEIDKIRLHKAQDSSQLELHTAAQEHMSHELLIVIVHSIH